ncbi:MAG: LptF/LptG family permease [candidate division Zixibacteria bacterium]|nr:LptF/LptG family permease [candidate division Zixibacteria bacterium]
METKTKKITSGQSPVAKVIQLIDFRNKLSLYVLREHIGPFIFAFIIITFILIIDFVPRLVDMIVGKELPASVILKVFFFQMGWMIALSVPMSVLVATLMAFGRLTSDFEITACKASGVHVMRLMYPVLLAAAALTYGMVYFNNEVLPDLNHKARVIMQDVRRMRPTLQIRSGAFVTDIKGYIILIDSVDHKTSNLTGVKILEMGRHRKSPRTIVAQSGRLTFTNGGHDLVFDLKDGEIHEFDDKSSENYRRLAFATQRIVVSEISKDFKESDDKFRTDREKSSQRMLGDIMKWQTGIKPYRDKINKIITRNTDRLIADTLPPLLDSLVPDNFALKDLATALEAQARMLSRENEGVKTQQKLIDSYYVEVYKKYSIPSACLVFVLIGAPMGILARKGSMGISIGLSLGLFILYWAFLMGGESLADRGIITPFWAMWAANILLGIIGLYLLYVVSFEKSLLCAFKLTKDKVKNSK